MAVVECRMDESWTLKNQMMFHAESTGRCRLDLMQVNFQYQRQKDQVCPGPAM